MKSCLLLQEPLGLSHSPGWVGVGSRGAGIPTPSLLGMGCGGDVCAGMEPHTLMGLSPPHCLSLPISSPKGTKPYFSPLPLHLLNS